MEYRLKITDTAGIRDTEDVVEKIGVEKSKEKIEEADLIILMLDASRYIDEEDSRIINKIKNRKYIVLLNKMDLKDIKIQEEILKNLSNIINISAKTGEGIDILKDEVKKLFFNGEISSESLIISNARHKQAYINH